MLGKTVFEIKNTNIFIDYFLKCRYIDQFEIIIYFSSDSRYFCHYLCNNIFVYFVHKHYKILSKTAANTYILIFVSVFVYLETHFSFSYVPPKVLFQLILPIFIQ